MKLHLHCIAADTFNIIITVHHCNLSGTDTVQYATADTIKCLCLTVTVTSIATATANVICDRCFCHYCHPRYIVVAVFTFAIIITVHHCNPSGTDAVRHAIVDTIAMVSV